MYPKKILVLNTIAPAAADIAVLNGILTIGNTTDGYISVNTRAIVSGGAQKLAYNAGTPGVYTIPIPATPLANTDYRVIINGFPLLFPAQPTAPTTAQLYNYFSAGLTGGGSLYGVTISGTSPNIVVTSNNAPNNYTEVVSANLPIVVTTPSVSALGTVGDVLARYGLVVAGASGFNLYEITYTKTYSDNITGVVSYLKEQVALLVNLADGDSGAFVTAMDNIIDGLNAGGTVANNEFISVRS